MILNWNKKNKADKPVDVKGIRDMLIRFIKDQLQKFEGGEGGNIHDITLFITCSKEERPLYDAALYRSEEDKFKLEIQKIADDYAIDLPEGWLLLMKFTAEFPVSAIKDESGTAAIIIKTQKAVKQQVSVSDKAVINILIGEAGEQTFDISPALGKVNIGRGAHVKVDDGSVRVNTIAFTDDSTNNVNRFVSRRHAHLEWNAEAGCYMAFADEGGIPPGNKTKIKTAGVDVPVKLNATNMGYRLGQGDQVILGDAAVLEIRYKD